MQISNFKTDFLVAPLEIAIKMVNSQVQSNVVFGDVFWYCFLPKHLVIFYFYFFEKNGIPCLPLP